MIFLNNLLNRIYKIKLFLHVKGPFTEMIKKILEHELSVVQIVRPYFDVVGKLLLAATLKNVLLLFRHSASDALSVNLLQEFRTY